MKQDLESYQKSVQEQNQQHQTSNKESTLTCSEHSVFGKFDAFCSRLKKILRLYDVIEKHENLLKSRMEGLLQEEEGNIVPCNIIFTIVLIQILLSYG